jgi:hypothetical protein
LEDHAGVVSRDILLTAIRPAAPFKGNGDVKRINSGEVVFSDGLMIIEV